MVFPETIEKIIQTTLKVLERPEMLPPSGIDSKYVLACIVSRSRLLSKLILGSELLGVLSEWT